jgi:hypothetical protein
MLRTAAMPAATASRDDIATRFHENKTRNEIPSPWMGEGMGGGEEERSATSTPPRAVTRVVAGQSEGVLLGCNVLV